jgi:hypothetical protein
MELTPALIGAKPGHIECDVNVDDMAYWPLGWVAVDWDEYV